MIATGAHKDSNTVMDHSNSAEGLEIPGVRTTGVKKGLHSQYLFIIETFGLHN